MDKPPLKNRYGLLIAFLVGLIAGLAAMYLYPVKHAITSAISVPLRQGHQVREMGHYRFINPLLECEVAEGTIDARKENFKKDLFSKVQQLMDERNLVISIYYRDLNNGPAFGIKETEEFIPASLLKVPIMMVYYREADDNPNVLNEVYSYDNKADLGQEGIQHIAPSHEIVLGKAYTVNELIDNAIIYSDNQAVKILIDHLSENDLRDLYKLLGVTQVPLTFPDASMTVREYASFFRILFNASYLSREFSEKALELLTRVDFRGGLVAGVPSDVVVAHKFGESGFEENKQIHDCGIVYAKNRPYLLCIMTRGGADPNALISTIADLSRYVYEKVSTQNN